MNGFLYQSIIGSLAIYEENGSIVRIEQTDKLCKESIFQETSIIRQTMTELDEYFQGKRTVFSIPIKHHRQGFQAKVLEELQKIPYGTALSYQQVAENIGHPRAYRAVGGACHHNPLPILIPCHRVIASNGSLTGFGWGVETKQNLLLLEKKFSK